MNKRWGLVDWIRLVHSFNNAEADWQRIIVTGVEFHWIYK